MAVPDSCERDAEPQVRQNVCVETTNIQQDKSGNTRYAETFHY